MRKSLILFAAALFVTTQALATYFVILKDGTQYRAKAKPTVANGKATVLLESGQMLQIDPSLIDFAKSDQATGLGGSVLAVGQTQTTSTQSNQSTLGSAFKLRKLPGVDQTTTVPVSTVPTGPLLSTEVLSKFERAYENVGIYEHKLSATGTHSLRAEVTADNEEKVFNAISATSFLMVRNAGVPGVQVDEVELFMRTTTGGSAGRFQMTRDDAQTLDTKQMTLQDYFVHKVLY